MKKCLLVTVLTAMFVSPAVFAQEPFELEPPPQEAMEHEIRMRNMQLEQQQHETEMDLNQKMKELELKKQHMLLQQEEAEMDFNQKMRELELEEHRMALERQQRPQKHPDCFARHRKGRMFPLLAICCIVHILVGVWIYQDIRRRNAGSGIWIVLGVLTGLFGALVYAVVRLGDSGQAQ